MNNKKIRNIILEEYNNILSENLVDIADFYRGPTKWDIYVKKLDTPINKLYKWETRLRNKGINPVNVFGVGGHASGSLNWTWFKIDSSLNIIDVYKKIKNIVVDEDFGDWKVVEKGEGYFILEFFFDFDKYSAKFKKQGI